MDNLIKLEKIAGDDKTLSGENIIAQNELKIVNKISNKNDVIDMNLKTDYSERLLDEVGANLREVDRNVNETAVSLHGQGYTLKHSNQTVDNTDNNVKSANLTIRRLSWGQRVQLILLNLIAILLFIGIIILLVIRILNYKA